MKFLKELSKLVKSKVHKNIILSIMKENLANIVCALFDIPDKKLRLYSIRYGSVAIILGGGGYKDKSIRAYQEDPKLMKEANYMIAFSKDIMNKIKGGELRWSKDGKKLEQI